MVILRWFLEMDEGKWRYFVVLVEMLFFIRWLDENKNNNGEGMKYLIE
jgi:hypothetical protein